MIRPKKCTKLVRLGLGFDWDAPKDIVEIFSGFDWLNS